MSPRLKLILIALVGLGVLIGVLEVLLPRLLFSPARLESLRKRAETGLRGATEGEVHIARIHPKLSLFRGLHVQIGQIVLKNPRRPSLPLQSVLLESISASFSLKSLLSGQPRVKTLEISGCRVELRPTKEASIPPDPRILLAKAPKAMPPKGSQRLPLGLIPNYLQRLEVDKLTLEGLKYGPIRVLELKVGFDEGRIQAMGKDVVGFGIQKGILEVNVLFPNPNPFFGELSYSFKAKDIAGSLEAFFPQTSPVKKTSYYDAELRMEGLLPRFSLTSQGSLKSALYPEPLKFGAEGAILWEFKGIPKIERAECALSPPNQGSFFKLELSSAAEHPYRFKAEGKGIVLPLKTLKRGSLSLNAGGHLDEQALLILGTLQGTVLLEKPILTPNPDTTIEADSLKLVAKEGQLHLPRQSLLWNQTPFQIEAKVEDFKKAEARMLAERLALNKDVLVQGLDVFALTQNVRNLKKPLSFRASIRSLRIQKMTMESLEGHGTGVFDPKGLSTVLFDDVKAEWMGGKAQGPLRVAFKRGGFSMSTPGMALKGIATSQAIKTFSKKDPKVYLDTKVSGPVSFERPFAQAHPFQKGLSGSGNLVLGPGRIHELYLYATLKKHLNSIPPLQGFTRAIEPFVLEESQKKGYSFDSGRISFSYEPSGWHIQSAKLESSRGISMVASGRIDADKSVEGQGQAIVSEDLSASMIQGLPQAAWLAKKAKITIPLTLKGNIGHVQVLPDVQQLGKSLLPNLLDNLLEGLKGIPSFLK